MTTTKSPVSMCGVNIVLPFPRRRFATVTARRPSGRSFASTTYHLRSIPLDLGENVVMNCLRKRARNLWVSRSSVNGILQPGPVAPSARLAKRRPAPIIGDANFIRHRDDLLHLDRPGRSESGSSDLNSEGR